ncbi:ChaN family lipoprotein [Magnetospira sp. QH-2]|uniref:ChaN family lipoprotein n=1 Tax=Magnetospira sp. (strain QH-2) TaxID=1288970 RepID=UPI0003E81C27|nr:ChaN family lipoprotein [Magnetospira sp. QH-2]CCQ75169.1 conserved exported protein of unknown function [Magnetospira sp. QH-2]
MLRPFVIALAALLTLPALADTSPDACVATGQWTRASDGRALESSSLLLNMSRKPAVLLGESHDNWEHHRWQLDTVAGLHALNPNMVLGFESFPRRVQPILDQWTSGQLGEAEFLDRVEWGTVWGYPAEQYMPLFHFARRHRIPMVALNVDLSLIRKVRVEGWEAVDEGQRRGVGTPAEALPTYRERLTNFFRRHEAMRKTRKHGEPATAVPHTEDPKDTPFTEEEKTRLERFIDAQLLWDRAMAEAVASVRTAGGNPLVIGIMGSGHLTGRQGAPHQLADLGIPDAAVLLPWIIGDEDCAQLAETKADAVYGLELLPQPAKKPRMLLGVFIEGTDDGVLISKVSEGSVAETTGILAKDVITKAAGQTVRKAKDLKEIITSLIPGVWLPLEVKRGDETLHMIAKFPAQP